MLPTEDCQSFPEGLTVLFSMGTDHITFSNYSKPSKLLRYDARSLCQGRLIVAIVFWPWLAIAGSAVTRPLSQPGPSHSMKISEPLLCDRAWIYLLGHCTAALMSAIVQFRKQASGSLWVFHQLLLLPTPVLRPLFSPPWGVESLHFHTALP